MTRKEIAFIIVVFVFALKLECTNALHCYVCGDAVEGMSTVTPCSGPQNTFYEECQDKAAYCKKYVNEGVYALSCAEQCFESHSRSTDIYCCTEDGCNGSKFLTPNYYFIFLVICFAILNVFLVV